MQSSRLMALTLGGMTVAALMTAGCGSSDQKVSSTSAASPSSTATPSADATAGAGSPASPSAKVTTTVTASPSASAHTAAPSALERCHTSQLSASVTSAGAAAGQVYQNIVLKNTSSQKCSVHGFGGFKLIGKGTTVPTNLIREKATATTSELAPGESASSQIHWTDVSSGNEPTSTACEATPVSAWVTPPDETDHLAVSWKNGPVCGKGRISQQPYVAGVRTPAH